MAGRQAEHPELADVVGNRGPARAHQTTGSLNVLLAERRHHRVGHRLAEFIDYAAGDDGAARQAEIDVVHRLVLTELERFTRFIRPGLAVRQVDVRALARGERIAAGREILELVLAVRGGGDRSTVAQLLRGHPDQRLAQRLTVICRDDPAADPRGTGRRRCVLPRPTLRRWNAGPGRGSGRLPESQILSACYRLVE